MFLLSGLFAPERVIRNLALARGMRVPTYEIASSQNALIFGHDAPAPLYDTTAAWEGVRDRPLTVEQRAAIERLLADRIRGVGAHESYFRARSATRRPSRVRSSCRLEAGWSRCS